MRYLKALKLKMLMTILIWLMAIISIFLWGFNFSFLFHRQIYEWFDNKFGKDDPMPPMQNKLDISNTKKD